MHKSLLTVAALAALLSTNAMAQNALPTYGEIATANITLKDLSSNNLGTFKPRATRITLGQVVSPSVAVEEFAYVGSSTPSLDATLNGVSTNVSKKQNNLYGVALRPFFNVTESLELFARLGIAREEITTTKLSLGQSQATTNTATNQFYSAGASYSFNRTVKATVDYSRFGNKVDTQLSNLSLGLRFNF